MKSAEPIGSELVAASSQLHMFLQYNGFFMASHSRLFDKHMANPSVSPDCATCFRFVLTAIVDYGLNNPNKLRSPSPLMLSVDKSWKSGILIITSLH
jgi:hypothetical protein